MSDDIVTRLRGQRTNSVICEQAADEIEELRVKLLAWQSQAKTNNDSLILTNDLLEHKTKLLDKYRNAAKSLYDGGQKAYSTNEWFPLLIALDYYEEVEHDK
jgi:DNA repair exonuclease SbcCD ATPase subunit